MEDRNGWRDMDEGCTCHLGHPPCGYCTHPGNPENQEEDPDAWEEGPEWGGMDDADPDDEYV